MNDSAIPVAAATARDETKTNKSRTPKRAPDVRSATAATRSAPARSTTKTKASVARRGTKTAKILALLQRPDGASISELKKATGWQAHSLRGFFSGVLKNKLKLRVTSTKRQDGERSYRVRSK